MEIYTCYSNIDKNLIYSDWNEVFDCIANLLNRIDSGLTHKLKDSYYQWEYSIEIYLKTLKREAVQPFPKLRTLETIRPFNLSNFSIIGKQENNQEVLLKMRDVLNDNIVTLTLIKSMVEAENNKKYLTLRGDVFIYNNSKLEVNAGTHAYSLLRAIYEYLDGQSGEISYVQFSDEVRKNKRYKEYTNKKVRETLQKYITTGAKTKGGLEGKLKPVEMNGKPLIEIIKDFGMRFNNE